LHVTKDNEEAKETQAEPKPKESTRAVSIGVKVSETSSSSPPPSPPAGSAEGVRAPATKMTFARTGSELDLLIDEAPAAADDAPAAVGRTAASLEAVSVQFELPEANELPTTTEEAESTPLSAKEEEKVVKLQALLRGQKSRKEMHRSHGEAYKVLAVNIWTYHILRLMASLLLSSPWPILYALVIDCFAGLSPSVGSTILVGIILVFNAQAFEAMGRMLSEFAGASGVAVAVTFASIFSQLLVIAGGFYKTVTFPLFTWIGHINAIKYGFGAIAKIYFKSTDSFWATPPGSIAVRGHTFSSLEFMGAFTALRTRGVTVVDSLAPPTIWLDIVMLLVLSTSFRLLCFGCALFKAHWGTFRNLRGAVHTVKTIGSTKNLNAPPKPGLKKHTTLRQIEEAFEQGDAVRQNSKSRPREFTRGAVKNAKMLLAMKVTRKHKQHREDVQRARGSAQLLIF